MKKSTVLKLTLIITVIVTCICAFSLSSKAEIVEGTCGDGLTWTLDTDIGVLKIEGIYKDFYDYTDKPAPWSSYNSKIHEIRLPPTISWDFANELNIFYPLENLESIKFGDSDQSETGRFYVKGNCLVDGFSGTLLLGCNNASIPSEVSHIGDYAFYNKKLKVITLPENTVSIGSFAFANCTSLTDIHIPKNLTTVGDYAFSKCYSLKTLELPDTVGFIGEGAFNGCGFTHFKIPSSLSSIPFEAFRSSKLNSINIPESVKHVGSNAFSSCMKLTSVYFENGTVSIGDGAFKWCENLETVRLSNELTAIPYDCFADCIKLKNIVIPEKVKSIGRSAFAYCKSLEVLNIPDSVSVIENYAFEHCYGIREMYVSKNVSKIHRNSFSSLPSAPSISPENPYYRTAGNCIIEIPSKKLILAYKDHVIPDDGSVTVIGSGAFPSFSGTEIIIPDSVTVIESNAFGGEKIEKITLSKNLKTIGDECFSFCTSIKEIIIPEGVTEIGNSAFENCLGLKSVTLPDSLEKIGSKAFYCCTTLESVNFPKNLKELPDLMFYRCVRLKSVDLTNVTTIGDEAFRYCEALELLYIPAGINSIGKDAFNDCKIKSTVFENESMMFKYPAAVTDATFSSTVYINSEDIAKDPSKYPLFNCGSVDNIALKSEYAPNESWSEFYKMSEERVIYNNTEYTLFCLTPIARKSSTHNKYYFEDSTGHMVSNTEKEEHYFPGCPGICARCNYMVETDTHGKSEIFVVDDMYHYRKCNYCPDGHDIWDNTKHTWDKGKVTLAPTLDAPGKIWHKCVDCGYNKIFPLAQLQPEDTATPIPSEVPDASEAPDSATDQAPTEEPTKDPETEAPKTNTPSTDPLLEANDKNSLLTTLLVLAGIIILAMSVVMILPLLKGKKK
ncbi:MAG: hypothetical protein E7675_02445 [Ruminococcaceae bacterium]|nr:hypothetical protein [Oscillospiraceae bacterium]